MARYSVPTSVRALAPKALDGKLHRRQELHLGIVPTGSSIAVVCDAAIMMRSKVFSGFALCLTCCLRDGSSPNQIP